LLLAHESTPVFCAMDCIAAPSDVLKAVHYLS
jgi:hypothetical protein